MNNRLRITEKPRRPPDTINDIASELGLSKTTISRVISGTGRISAETRERVLSHIKDRGFHPSHIAKSLAVSKTFNIAVVLPSDAEISAIPFFQTCLNSITETANARDYDVVVSVSAGQNITGLKRLIRNRKVDGAILTRPLSEDKAIAVLRESGLPFVVIGSKDDPSLVQVDSDHFNGCREVTAHVLGSGFRRVFLLAGDPSHQVNKDRYAGFLAAFESAGVVPDPGAALWNMAANSHIEKSMPAVMRKKPDCVICMDDAICGRLLSWLRKNDYSIPGDARVVSFHDSAFMEMHNPPVTALHIEVPELGAAAAGALLDMIAGKQVPAMNRVGYSVIVRDSSRPR